MTCVLVISTSGRIYTEPAGGPGLTVYRLSVTTNHVRTRSTSVLDAVADESTDNMLLRNYYMVVFSHLNQFSSICFLNKQIRC